MVSIGPKHTKTSDPCQQQLFCLAWSPKEASPLSVQPGCKQGPLCLSSDPFCLLKAESEPVALLLASQSTFRLHALFSPSTPSSLKQPTTFVWIYRAAMARVQTWAGRISGGPASSYSATHNILVILLGTSDSDVTLLLPGSWWDRVRCTGTITLAPIRPQSAEQKAWLQPSFKPWHN